jgi:hypothetical protein
MSTAIAVQEAEKHEKFNESFYTSFREELNLRSPSPRQRGGQRPNRTADQARAVNYTSDQRDRTTQGNPKVKTENRNAQTRTTLTCYECESRNHYGHECPTRPKRENRFSHSPGKRNQSERSKRPHSSGERPAFRTGHILRIELELSRKPDVLDSNLNDSLRLR